MSVLLFEKAKERFVAIDIAINTVDKVLRSQSWKSKRRRVDSSLIFNAKTAIFCIKRKAGKHLHRTNGKIIFGW